MLAADVQVGEPSTGEEADSVWSEDEVRFSLTSEAGLNDGLAFPFVYAALALADAGGSLTAAGVFRWLAVDVGYRLVAGVLVGWLVGRLLSWMIFSTSRFAGLASSATGFVVLAATLVAYGTAEVVHAYGFLAVFVAAVTIRSAERSHSYHNVLHDFADEIEQLLIVGLLVLLGGALVDGLLAELTLAGLAVGLAAIFVVRPLACRVALIRSRTTPPERRTVAFFGIRGIGSFYYLAYAASGHDLPDIGLLWGIVAVTVLLSIVIHGVAAAPVMRRLDRYQRQRSHSRRRTLRVGPAVPHPEASS